MTVEQYKELRKKQREDRAYIISWFYPEREAAKPRYRAVYGEYADKKMKQIYRLPNQHLKLPKNLFTQKIRKSIDEMVLNDIAALEGGIDLESAYFDYGLLKEDMISISGKQPKSYFFIISEHIPDIKKGFFSPYWEGDSDSIISILERNGLNVTIENSRLIIKENNYSDLPIR